MKPNDTPRHSTVQGQFVNTDDSNFVDKIRNNVKSDVIVITEDKLENILLKHLSSCDVKRAWLAPASVFVTVLLANTTATFVDKMWLAAATWEAVFFLLGCGSFFWLIFTLVRIIVVWKEASLAHLLGVIKNAQD